MVLFKGKYRIPSARLKNWNYAAPGLYFVTVCTWQALCSLGTVRNQAVRLSPAGQIIAEEWQRTAQVRPNVGLDAWIIMPNHVHGILAIKYAVETPQVETPQPGGATTTNATHWKPGVLGAIIGQFKSRCTKRIWALGDTGFRWQARFYDHIIRTPQALANIRRYIENNPAQWENEKPALPDVWM
jgi:REP element-mobilizing transposase RayT